MTQNEVNGIIIRTSKHLQQNSVSVMAKVRALRHGSRILGSAPSPKQKRSQTKPIGLSQIFTMVYVNIEQNEANWLMNRIINHLHPYSASILAKVRALGHSSRIRWAVRRRQYAFSSHDLGRRRAGPRGAMGLQEVNSPTSARTSFWQAHVG